MFVDYSSLRDKDRLHNPRSTERSDGAECHCDFCEFQKNYEVQFEEIKHTMEKGKSIDLHEEDEGFFVTTAETGYILKSLSAKVFSGSISQPEQMKTTGILVPSVYDLNNGDQYSPKPVKGAVSIYCRDDFVGICLFQDKNPDSPQSSFSGFIFAQVVSENSNEGTELKNRYAGESSRQAAAKLRSRQNSRYDHWIDISSSDEHQADPERRTAAFRPVNREEEQLMLNQTSVTETFVMMLCQTAATVWSASNTSNSLSRNELLREY
ncbi:hypothetical protein OWV82_006680 [Melia azedarach]|uniref:Uncharacterized protein n=1 Tax=Melia azedarach TaxID=155640 RepID=A0ACC1YIU4_MELAZ|nr:hypothetical protein OWV82_006680 [Melia azedarach]